MAEKLKKFPIGGTHLPEEEKALTSEFDIVVMKPPQQVAIPLKQHSGVPSRPVVEPGDVVRRGTLIAMNDQGLSARIHASIPGRVNAIEQRELQDGQFVDCVVIDYDEALGETEDRMKPLADSEITPDSVRERVEEAGIVGLGGGGFPTHIKLKPSAGVEIDTVIVNGAECEPYLSVDDRLMREQTHTLFRGLDLLCRTVGAEHGMVACEINKPKALEILRDEAGNWSNLSSVALDTRYPHGAEKHLIKAVLDREVPRNALPSAVGALVNNVQTTVSIAKAVYEGEALSGRVLTVSGHALKEPRNLVAPLGASYEDILNECGGLTQDDVHLIVGGPMTGIRVYDLGIPMTKTTSGLVALTPSEAMDYQEMACIRCGKCVEVCPMYLAPNRLVSYINNEMYDEAQNAGLTDCILCGSCAFVCPSRRGLIQTIKRGKAELANRQRQASNSR